ncbi:hypothetical protein ACH5RR_014965 [Cinchona calisaya]|uniref:EF-hand domain-containing protein n=1 Tax=Cinchona calisaya TaxID=153742 RepID=A0ABD2ZTG7_9GENT
MASKRNEFVQFEDFFPSMVERLGAEGFLDELCNGFRLLMDQEKGLITLESLKKNSGFLGLQEMMNNEELLWSMIEEGDLDGDGNLNEMEFCVLMFRLSPELMKTSRMFLEEALTHA